MDIDQPDRAPTPMIVVGVDDRRPTASAPDLRAAAAEALRRGASIRVVHGCATRSPAGIIGDNVTQERISYGLHVLDAAVEVLRGLTGGEVAITTSNSRDLGADALLAESATAALVVLLHRRSAGRGPATGTTTSNVGGRARCPVLIVPQDAATTDPSGGVVVAVDERGPRGALVRVAAAEAAWRAVPLTAVHAWQPSSDPWAAPGPVLTEEAGRGPETAGRARLRAATEALAVAFPHVVVRSELVRGPTVDVLLAFSRRAGLLVVGRSHDPRPGGTALGEVAAALVDRALCPVLISPVGPSPGRSGPATDARLDPALAG